MEQAGLCCEDLAAYLEGRLPEDILEAMADHVSACARCAAAQEANQDSGEKLLAGAGNPAAQDLFVQEPEYLRLEARVRAWELPASGGTILSPPGTSLAPERREEEFTPSPFGKYLLCERLGHGAMGVVYKAQEGSPLKRVVALKMVLAGVHAKPELLGRFRLEIEALGRLHHPNIVTIYECSE
jgi:hypothetical protein